MQITPTHATLGSQWLKKARRNGNITSPKLAQVDALDIIIIIQNEEKTTSVLTTPNRCI